MRYIEKIDREWRFTQGRGDLKERYVGMWDAYGTTRSGNHCDMACAGYDDSEWRNVTLPHDWMTEVEFSRDHLAAGGYKKRGAGWYRREFFIDETHRGRNISLVFEGIANTCEVYFNGSLLERNFSAYNEFSVDLSDRVLPGQRNAVAVYVDGRDIEGWWYEGAGIYRHVWLVTKDDIHFTHNGCFIYPQKIENDLWRIRAKLSVENTSYIEKNVTARVELYNENGEFSGSAETLLDISPESTQTVELCCMLEKPELWDIDTPTLYMSKCRLMNSRYELDTECAFFGCRTIEVSSENGFMLNGKRLLVRGTCCHQDHAGIGIAVPDTIVEYRIRLLKEAGFNAYRSAHHPPSRALLDACDRQGMMIMDENRRFEGSRETIRQLEAMICRDRNHPSVVFYSLFNEEPLAATEAGGWLFRRLKNTVLRLDESRLITGGMNERTMFGDGGAALQMDITGFNYSLASVEEFHEKFPSQPVIGTENGAAYGTRGCYVTNMEERRISCDDTHHEPFFNSIRETCTFFERRQWIAGYFLWSGFDYRGEPCPMAWPSISSQFGIMDTCGFPKGGYWFYKACTSSDIVLQLTPHWNHSVGETVQVTAITNCDTAELSLNGGLIDRQKVIDYVAQWEIPFKAGKIEAVGFIDGNPRARSEQITTGKAAVIQMLPDRCMLHNDGEDTVPVNIYTVDNQGVLVPDASCHIKFTVEGDGIILGCGNGDPTSHEIDALPERDLFAGWCQVLVRTEPGAKQLMLKATADGLKGSSVTFNIF